MFSTKHGLVFAAIALLCFAAGSTDARAFILQEDPSTFEEFRVTDPLPIRFGTAAVGDFDQDGDFDLVLSGLAVVDENTGSVPYTKRFSYAGLTSVEIFDPNTGEVVNMDFIDYQQFSNAESISSVWKSALAVGDFNGDNYADLAVSGLNADGIATLTIYEYAVGLGRFVSARSLSGLHSGDLAWGDVDNDGDQDLAACGLNESGEPELRVHLNNNNNLVSAATQTVLIGISVCSIEWGDYDADGDMDLVAAGIDRLGIPLARVYDNDGSGGLVGADFQIEGLSWPSVAWGDYDADGDLDLLVSGARFTPLVLEGFLRVYVNNGGMLVDESDMVLSGAFENDPVTGRYDGMISWGDYKNRGYPGFAVTGLETPSSAETLQLYPNIQGTGFRRSDSDIYDGGVRGATMFADLDGDLDLDLLLVGETRRTEGTGIRVFRNDLRFGLRVPTAPSEVQAVVNRRQVTLGWSAATDRQTPAPGLTYNLRVGTSPGKSDVMTPLSNLDTGARFVAGRGNVGHNTSWTLRNLPPGTYYWSVQAIDQSFAASGFTDEQQFTVDG